MSEIPEGGLPGGSDGSPRYRVLLFAGDGKVRSNVPIPVPNDEAAKMVARRMANGLSAELWDGLRYIDRFDGLE